MKTDKRPVKSVCGFVSWTRNSVSRLRLKSSGADVNQQTASPLLNVPRGRNKKARKEEKYDYFYGLEIMDIWTSLSTRGSWVNFSFCTLAPGINIVFSRDAKCDRSKNKKRKCTFYSSWIFFGSILSSSEIFMGWLFFFFMCVCPGSEETLH